MGPIYSVDDFLDMVRRHLRLIVGVVLLGAAVSLLVAEGQQHLYRSSEVIQIARPKIADDLARSTVAGSSARRLQLIEQQIMARGSLLMVIEKLDLFQDMPAATLSEKINLLRESVTINGVAAVREGFADDGTISVLTITATMPTAEQAQAVARELSARTIALSEQTRQEQTRATLEFFIQQEQQLTAEIAALEQEVAEFRAVNDLAIPGSLEFRRGEIQTINAAILEIERSIIAVQRDLDKVDPNARRATVERETADLQSELEGLTQQRDLLQGRVDRLRASIETSPDVERALSNFERQMIQLQARLDVVSTRRNEAEVGARLEERNNAEQLTVLETAPLPDYPVTASKKRLALMGTAASGMLGLVLAFLLDLRHPVLRTPAQMKRETGLSPVVAIPVLNLPSVRPSPWTRLRLWMRNRRDTRAVQQP